jgi:uncharacterized protein YjiK
MSTICHASASFETRNAQAEDRWKHLRPYAFFLLMLPILLLDPREARASDLKFIDRVKIFEKSVEFKEPSGLAMLNDGKLLSVSDNVPKIFQLQTDGDLVSDERISENKSLDLEGIAVRDDEALLAVAESSRTILLIERTSPPRVTKYPLNEMSGYGASVAPLLVDNPEDKGLEGITVNGSTGIVYVAFENQPRLLLSVSPDLTEIVEVKLLNVENGLVSDHAVDDDLDISGLAWANEAGVLWIVSDKGSRVFAYNPVHERAVGFDLSFEDDGKEKLVKNAEGITVDEDKGVLYVVTDDKKKSRLYAFELPSLIP